MERGSAILLVLSHHCYIWSFVAYTIHQHPCVDHYWITNCFNTQLRIHLCQSDAALTISSTTGHILHQLYSSYFLLKIQIVLGATRIDESQCHWLIPHPHKKDKRKTKGNHDSHPRDDATQAAKTLSSIIPQRHTIYDQLQVRSTFCLVVRDGLIWIDGCSWRAMLRHSHTHTCAAVLLAVDATITTFVSPQFSFHILFTTL